MVCVYCGHATQVINSRHQRKVNQVWRRRECTHCHAIFTTREAVDTTQALRIKRNNSYQPFSRDIMLLSIYDSLRHRKTAETDATALTATILSKLYPLIKDATLDRADITRTATVTLTRFDKAAGTHYQAFHPASR